MNAPAEKKIRVLWLAYLEPNANAVLELWRPNVYRVPVDVAQDLLASLQRIGCIGALDRTEDGARAKLDDLRKRCFACEDGFGHYLCSGCSSAVLVGQLEQSVRRAS